MSTRPWSLVQLVWEMTIDERFLGTVAASMLAFQNAVLRVTTRRLFIYNLLNKCVPQSALELSSPRDDILRNEIRIYASDPSVIRDRGVAAMQRLSLRVGQAFFIKGSDATITVEVIRGNRVRLCVDGSEGVLFRRDDVLKQLDQAAEEALSKAGIPTSTN